MTTKQADKLSPVNFGRDFAGASGKVAALAALGKANFPKFPDRAAMSEKHVKGITEGIQLHFAEDRKAKGQNLFVVTDSAYVHVTEYMRKAKLAALPAGTKTIEVTVEKALEQTKVTLDLIKSTDPRLQAAYVQIRDRVSTEVSKVWARIRAAVAKLDTEAAMDKGSKKRGTRGATKLFRDAVYEWADGLVKKAKLAKERGDGTAPDAVKLAALVATFKKDLAALAA